MHHSKYLKRKSGGRIKNLMPSVAKKAKALGNHKESPEGNGQHQEQAKAPGFASGGRLDKKRRAGGGSVKGDMLYPKKDQERAGQIGDTRYSRKELPPSPNFGSRSGEGESIHEKTYRAKGGRTRGNKTNITIVLPSGKQGEPPLPAPPVAGAGGGPPLPPPAPPMPPGGPPMGGPPMMPRARGGRATKPVKMLSADGVKMTAGAGSGVGRAQLAKLYKKKH